MLLGLLVAVGPSATAATPLTTLDYRVVGTSLRPVPEVVTVPKDIRGSVALEFRRGDGSPATGLSENLAEARFEGTLRGPSYPAQRVVGEPGKALLLPALRVAGDYQLDDLRLVRPDGSFLAAEPSTIPVKVIDEVLVSHVTSRPLSLDEIRDKGIAIDESSFRAVEFDVTLVLQGKRVSVQFPVVAPAFKTSTEIIPAAELEDRRVQADLINQELLRNVTLPPDLQVAMPDFTVAPINFEEVMDGDGEVERKPPSITGLLVIPGSIGFLNQFFSVQLYTENVAPTGSGLSVNRLNATIQLPAGRDTNSPIDDPLRLARVGADKLPQPVLPVSQVGPDGKPGTADDVSRLQPAETGVAEFLVEGLLEGLHLVKFQLEGELEGLAAGPTRIRGTASGSVLVRNASFSFTFSHPFTVRAGEPYEASVTVYNTSEVVQNEAFVALNRTAISGAVLMSEERVQLGEIPPGESKTATFRLRSQRTGSVLFSNLTTGEDSAKGKLSLFMGVDERGVALSGDSLGYPVWFSALPESLRRAADRVLGQTLGAVTAGRLPAGVIEPARTILDQRVVELAEAGQRLRYQDEPRRVLADLALDWQGGRVQDRGFDQIIRTTDAGREWREALALALEDVDFGTAAVRLQELAPSYAGLGQSWWLAAAGSRELSLTVLATDTPSGGPAVPELPGRSAFYEAPRGAWLATPPTTNRVIRWTAKSAQTRVELAFLDVSRPGVASLATWSIPDVLAGAEFSLVPDATPLVVTERGTGRTFPASLRETREELPRAISAFQDIDILTDRAYRHCPMQPWNNWGTVVAVLFSKPMRPEDVGVPGAFTFPDGNGARTVQLQPGGRVALLQLHRGIGSFPPARPRTYGLAVAAVPDPRGNRSEPATRDVVMVQGHGTSVRGRVLGLDGQPVAGVPVTLTMHDRVGNRCLPADYRAGQVFTDDNGFFTFDYILADVDFSLAAIDTSRLTDVEAQGLLGLLIEAVGLGSPDRARLEELARHATTREAVLKAFNVGEVGAAIVAAEGLDRAVYRDFVGFESGRDGSELNVVMRFRGRGRVAGRVLNEAGQPVAGAAVNLHPDADSRELTRGMFSDAEGRFEFAAVPLGVFTLDVATSDRRSRVLSDRLLTPGQQLNVDVVLPDQPVVLGQVRGQVFEADGRPHANATIYLALEVLGSSASGVVAEVTADADGFFLTRPVPARAYVAVAVTADGRRKGQRAVGVAGDSVSTVNVTLDAAATVKGIVRFWNEEPAPYARVGGGETVVRADDQGHFTLTGVPVGTANLIAGLDGSEMPDNITRTGSIQLNVRPGLNDDVEIRLGAFGRIYGVVKDLNGVEVANVRVAIPTTTGFYWVRSNEKGAYEFNRFGLGSYTVSAPSPPVKEDPEALAAAAISALTQAESPADVDAAAGLVGQLANLYAQGTVGRLVTQPFDPGSWGFTTATIRFDGDSAPADITYMAGASLRGTVVNHQGVPIGAEVSVRAFGPDKKGAPTVKNVATLFSAPDTGEWRASGFLIGPFQVTARSPLLTGVAEVEGLLTAQQAHRTNVVLQFPPQGEVTGRLVGQVLNPDGSPVTNGAVHIDFTSDYVIEVENGRFDTQLKLPIRDYRVTATNRVTQQVGQSSVRLVGGVTNFVAVRLLDQGALVVRVRQADGSPAAGARVRLDRYEFPQPEDAEGRHQPLELGTDGQGLATFGGLWEGAWTVAVRLQSGASALEQSGAAVVVAGRTNQVELRLGASGAIAGEFRENGSGTPIAGATVFFRLNQPNGPLIATAPTTADGRFQVSGLPLGTYFLVARNAVNGREGMGSLELTLAHPPATPATVTLVEGALGEVVGNLFQADGTNAVPGAEIVWSGGQGGAPSRRVTTGPSGEFRFPGVPVGSFSLAATAEVPGVPTAYTAGNGELSVANSPLRLDLRLPPSGSVAVTVLESDGSPASLATVRLGGAADGLDRSDTDAAGVARFVLVTLTEHSVEARSLRPGRLSSFASGTVAVRQAGETAAVTVQLSPVARLTGTLRNLQGQAVANARIDLTLSGDGPGEGSRTTLTAANGSFGFEDLKLGAWKLAVESGAQAAFASGTFTTTQLAPVLDLRLSGSGSVTGTVAREDGSELVGVDVVFDFVTAGGGPGFKQARTGPLGRFRADGLPIQTPLQLAIRVPEIDGRAFRTVRLTTNGQVLDLGAIRLDQRVPELTELVPLDGAVNVNESAPVVLTFSEPLDLLTVTGRSGIYLQSGELRVPADVTEATVTTPTGPVSQVTLTPRAPLGSQRTYDLLILGGDQVGRDGRPVSLGVEDRVGKPLQRTLVTRFTVRDYLPPVVLNAFPSDGAGEIEPAAVARFEFDEVIDTNRLELVVRGPGGLVPGAVGVNANQRLISFVPLRPLDPNAAYQAELRSVFDVVGNRMEPLTNRFATVDNLGPALGELLLAAGQRAVPNATVTLVARLAVPEPDVSVEFLRGNTSVGLATFGPDYTVAVRLPDLPVGGRVTYSAVAVDRLGNRGEARLLTLDLRANEPPTVTLVRGLGETAPAPSDGLLTLQVLATDDARLRQVVIEGSGAGTDRWVFDLGTNRFEQLVALRLPPTFVAGSDYVFRATARDDSGAQTVTAPVVVPTRDATKPRLTVVAPPAAERLDPRVPWNLPVTLRDNSVGVTLTARLLLNHVAFTNREVAVALTPNEALERNLTFDLSQATNGGRLDLELTATDGAGNQQSTNLTRTIRSVSGPRLVQISSQEVSPLPSTNRHSPWVPWVMFSFNKGIQAPGPIGDYLIITNQAGVAAPHTASLQNSVFISFNGPPLPPGSLMTLRLKPGLTDAEGNPVQLADGSDFPAEGIVVTFPVANFRGLGVTNGTPVVPGQTFYADVYHDPNFFGWNGTLNGVDGQSLFLPGTNSGSRIAVTLPLGATTARLKLQSRSSSRTPYVLPEIDLVVVSREGDADGDGLPNGWEADRSHFNGGPVFDPFDPEDADGDFDFDGLSNGAEYRLGTNPFNLDTDRDGLLDSLESPVRDGCPSALVADSDGDGFLDGFDEAPCDPGESLELAPERLTILAGVSTTNTLTLTARNLELNSGSLDFDAKLPRPSWVSFPNPSAEGTNPVTLDLVLRPSLANVGEFEVPLTLRAFRRGSQVLSNRVVRVTVQRNTNVATTRWKAPVDGDWEDPANWTAGLPGIGTNAVIDVPGTYTVTLQQATLVESLRVGGPSGTQTLVQLAELELNDASEIRERGVLQQQWHLQGQGSLAVAGRWIWQSGTVEAGAGGFQILPGGRWQLDGNGLFLQRPLENQGEAQWAPGASLALGSVTLLNAGTLVIPGADVANFGSQISGGSDSAIVQTGQLRLTGSETVQLIGLRFDQQGQIDWGTASLNLLGGGTNGTRLEVPAGSRLWLAGNWTHEAGATLGGAGALTIGGGNHQVLGRFEPTGPVEIETETVQFEQSAPQPLRLILRGGTVEFAAAQAFETLDLQRGALGGTGELTLRDRLDWSGGELVGPGRFVVPTEGLVSCTGGGHYLRCELVNQGTFELLGEAELWLDPGTLVNSGLLRVPGQQGGNGRFWAGFGVPGRVVNEGEMQLSGSADVAFIRVVLENRGVVRVAGVRLQATRGGVNQGRIEFNGPGGQADFDGEFIHEATGVIAGEGRVGLLGGTQEIRGSLALPEVSISGSGSGTVTGPGSLTVARRFDWSGSALRLAGGVRLESTATASLGTTQAALILATSLENRGTVTVEPGSSFNFDQGRIRNLGRWEMPGRVTYTWQRLAGSRSFENLGVLVKSADTVSFDRVDFIHRGTLEFTAGTLELDAVLNEAAIQVPAGGALKISPGESTRGFVQTAAGSLTGPGSVEFTAGTHDLAGTFRPTGPVRVDSSSLLVREPLVHPGLITFSSATVSCAAGGTVAQLSLLNGTLAVTNRLEVLGDVSWSGTSVTGGGTLFFGPQARVELPQSGVPRLSVRLENAGEMTLGNSVGISLQGATWVNLPGGTVRLDGSHNFSSTGPAPNLFLNQGTVIKTNAGIARFPLPVTQAGTFRLEGGEVQFSDGSRHQGAWHLAAGTELEFLGNSPSVFAAGTSFNGPGSLRFPFNAELVLEADLSFGATQVTFPGAASSTGAFTLANAPGGLIRIQQGKVRLAGPLEIGGTLRVEAAGSLEVEGPLRLLADARLVNLGLRVNGESNIRVRGPKGWADSQVEGVPPDVVPNQFPLRIDEILLRGPATVGLIGRTGTAEPTVRLRWRDTPGVTHRIEVSTDLRGWSPVTADLEEQPPGNYTAIVPAGASGARFLRVTRLAR